MRPWSSLRFVRTTIVSSLPRVAFRFGDTAYWFGNTSVTKLERRLTFLATTASVTPFIGLFGTVVGITLSFQQIGATGSTKLAVVGPGISEALIATAAGLFAAIPAVVFYNHFVHRVKDFSATMDDFALEFLNIAERNFT